MKKKGCLTAILIAVVLCVIGLSIILYLAVQDTKEQPKYTILENQKLERYAKSQIKLSVALTDTTATHEEVKELLHSLVHTTSNLKMEKRDKPTNVYVYIYKTKASFEADAVNWMMMYSKNNSQTEGTYTYHSLVSD